MEETGQEQNLNGAHAEQTANSNSETPSSAHEHFLEENYLGQSIQVGAGSLNMRMNGYTPNGNSTKGCHVGEFVIIASDSTKKIATIGQISEVTIDDSVQGPNGEIFSLGSIKLLTTVNFETGKITPGVTSAPQIGNYVFRTLPELVQAIVEAKNVSTPGADTEHRVQLHLANLPNATSTPVAFTPEMLFGRHMAILGTTGAGKSWSLARLMEECGKHRSKVILFDATGEYATLRNNTYHVYLGEDPNPPENAREVAIPYQELLESDLFAIFKPKGQSQAPKLREAIKSLKLAELESSLTLDGKIIKVNKSKQKFDEAYRRHQKTVDDPSAKFDISLLAEQIQNECIYPQRSEMEPNVWGNINGNDQAHCIPLINRIQDIINSHTLAPVFKPGQKPSLLKAIDAFLEDDNYSVLRVSLKYLSFDHNAREIITNAMGRHLMQMARFGEFKQNPILVVLDEAHQFLNKSLSTAGQDFPLEAFSIIAKEGRKYAISVCLATQRPRDIPEDVLSQMGTMIVHRLINDKDRGVVERASADVDQSVIASLPTLASGEAVIVGVEFPVPLSVKMKKPHNPPMSSGADYQSYWARGIV